MLCFFRCALLGPCLLPVLVAQTHVITFEEPGLVAMNNLPGVLVPAASRLGDQFLSTLGVSFRSTGGFAAVVVHGGASPTPPNILGGTTATGTLNYHEPVTIRFFDPNDPTSPGVTDFFRVRGDLTTLNTGTVTLQAFAVDGSLLGSTTVPDASPGAVLTLSFTSPGIHRVVFSGTSGTVGFDNVEFLPVRRAANYVPYGSGCPGSLGTPVLSAAPGSLPLLATTFSVQVSGVPAGIAAMISGLSNTHSGALPLPFDLSPLGLTGCHLLAEMLVIDTLLAAGTTATWSLTLPNTTNLLGVQIFDQAMVFDATANALGLVFSNAGAATIGY